MSDDELDREWKPNGRPQSTMARSFSASLNDLFKIDNSLADLDAAVDQKKKAVLNQTSELEALEARLKATEERLKQRQSMGYNNLPNRGSQSPRWRAPLGDTFASPASTTTTTATEGSPPIATQRTPTSPLASDLRPKTPTAARPQTGRREGSTPTYTTATAPPMPMPMSMPKPGALPPTPGTSEGDSSSEAETGDSSDESDGGDSDEGDDDDDDDGRERVPADYVVVAQGGNHPPPMPPPRSAHRPAP